MLRILLWPFTFIFSVIGLVFNFAFGLVGGVLGLIGGLLAVIFGGGFFILSIIGAVALVRWFIRGIRGV